MVNVFGLKAFHYRKLSRACQYRYSCEWNSHKGVRAPARSGSDQSMRRTSEASAQRN